MSLAILIDLIQLLRRVIQENINKNEIRNKTLLQHSARATTLCE